MKKALQITALLLVLAAATATAMTQPASAKPYVVTVQMADGTVQALVLDLPPGSQLQDVGALDADVPGVPVGIEPVTPRSEEPNPPASQPEDPEQPDGDSPEAPASQPEQPEAAPQAPAAEQPEAPAAAPEEEPTPPADEDEEPPVRPRLDTRRKTKDRRNPRPPKAKSKPQVETDTGGRQAPPLRNPDGSPTPSNPGYFDALPGPSITTGVPNFVIRKFRVPVFLLPIYQAAGIQYGIRWEILAAINEIETDYGRNLNVSSAGALGWMQFMPSTWEAYGTDANRDGRRDPYNPVDAIFAAARYLKAAGYEEDVRRAIFAYNHADWYVDSVMMRARLIAGVPADLVGSLTGLTEGRFPVAARARYADDLAEHDMMRRVRKGENAANVIESDDSRRGIEIYSQAGAPAVAVQDGVIKKVGTNSRLGRHVVLQDAYGNRYTYAQLDSLARYHPVPRAHSGDALHEARAMRANDPRPEAPASAGSQAPSGDDSARGPVSEDTPAASLPVKQRLFANPEHPLARDHGGLDQAVEHAASHDRRFETFDNYFSRPVRLDPDRYRLERLERGSRVIGGTILGRVGATVPGKASHLYFAIRPAGRGAPLIDPKPILDGWKLLEATAVYRAEGRNVLSGGASIGQIMMMSKPLLERRVLRDERIELYDCGRDDVRSGQVDRRVLATLAYLAESGFRPAVTSLKCGHSYLTASGNVSHHSSGNAVDIAMVNGIPILGHQEPGGITEQTVRALMRLQGTMQPDQIISLFDFGANTYAMADHADHIHVGFSPRFGANRKLGRQALMVLEPGQWTDLLDRLGEIENPTVPTRPSDVALPTRRGEGDVPRVPAGLPAGVSVNDREHEATHDEPSAPEPRRKPKRDGDDERPEPTPGRNEDADRRDRTAAERRAKADQRAERRARVERRKRAQRRQRLERRRAAAKRLQAQRRRARREAKRNEPSYPSLFPLPPIG